MNYITLQDVILIMAAALFILGAATFAAGVFVLVARAMGQDMRTLSSQTARLAEKGLAEDVSGLVGNAASLLTSMTQLVRTAAGVGVFLTTLGLGLIGASFWLILQIRWVY